MSSSNNKQSTNSFADTINRAFILAQKYREHLEGLSTDAKVQTFTKDELRACGHKRTRNDSLIDQTKLLESALNDLLRNPKYVSVSALKEARQNLLDAGVCMANPPKIENDVDDEDEDDKGDDNDSDGNEDDDVDAVSIDGNASDDDVKSGDESYSDDSDDSDDSNKEYKPSDASSNEDGDASDESDESDESDLDKSDESDHDTSVAPDS